MTRIEQIMLINEQESAITNALNELNSTDYVVIRATETGSTLDEDFCKLRQGLRDSINASERKIEELRNMEIEDEEK